ncbi:unnamed protein product [Caenorhabditis bovis]|uniref:Secreted protein n=1 Tax=Caenorhabditis bovis TaxID=2654633 RepID=A0A8S1E7Z0_9PELO|nr:unnamed protein product [Caenorhabditis bovis]
MNSNILLILCLVATAAYSAPTSSAISEDFDLDSFFGAAGDGHFANMDVDGVAVPVGKKTEKLPGQKKMKNDFISEIGEVPKLDKRVEKTVPVCEESDDDYFGEAQGPATNPAGTFLEGSDFEKVEAPVCTMLGCTGPIPNDGSYAILSSVVESKACGQMFVPLNGCSDNKGYPMGMLCSVCCDCTNSFVTEMKKTFGYMQGLKTASFSS